LESAHIIGPSSQGVKLGARQVRVGFEGGAIASDGGGLLLRGVEKRTGIVERFAACFTDHRCAQRVEHTVRELVAQRVYGLALGYEDFNDHDERFYFISTICATQRQASFASC
jgi:hypothetical protein